MFSRTVPLCVAFFLFAAFTPAQDAKMELEALQGKWASEYIRPSPETQSATLTIKGEQWTITAPWVLGNAAAKTTFKIDPSKNPKTIDLTTKIGDKETSRSLGIYKLEGDTLSVSYATGKRPTHFKSSIGEIFVFKRVKK